jgi:murein DD-endopeptidase MepM/ murein hydrolase activator NlpD
MIWDWVSATGTLTGMRERAPTNRLKGLRAIMAPAALLAVVVTAPAGPVMAKDRIVRVHHGDTVYALSRRYRVAVRDIIRVNRLKKPYHLLIGQRVRIPARIHVVKRGESVIEIGKTYGIAPERIIATNKLKRPDRLAVGQRLKLPTRVVRPAGRPSPAKASRRVVALRKRGRTKVPALSGRGFTWPVRGRVVVGYGRRRGGWRNDGINIAARKGAPVRAAENGVVAYAGKGLATMGQLVLLRHAGGWVTAYAHNQRVLVRRGQTVRRGQLIAQVGQSGAVPSPQLHFEIRKGDTPVNPLARLR